MQFYLDSANIDHITEIYNLGVLDGVTTNPSLISKKISSQSKQSEFEKLIYKIATLIDAPVSAEVISTKLDDIVDEAKHLSQIHPKIVVKIPLIEQGIQAVYQLNQLGIQTNVTLCFSLPQAILAAKVGASYISPFIGRLDDISQNGLNLIQQISTTYKNYHFKTKIIAASIRNPNHIVSCALFSCDIVTVSYPVIKQIFLHPLTQIGLDQFLLDWQNNS